MEKLFIWFNPKKKQVYHKLCRSSVVPVGYINQYGHILLTTLSIFDNKVFADLTYRDCYRVMAKKRNTRYRRLFNRFINELNRKGE